MNLAILVGTIVSDIIRTEMPNGGSVTKFRVRTVDQYSLDGEIKESSQTHLIDVWNNHLQNGIVKTLRKGQMVEVQGAINSRSISRENEPTRWTTTIVLRGSGIITVHGGTKSGMSVSSGADQQSEPSEPRIDHSRAPAKQFSAGDDGIDDDVPF